MIKRLAFVAGFGVGFIVGSASGRKSYESLRETAINTWNDPKVQDKVSEGTDWVKSEVPVVGGKLADTAQKAAGTVSAKAQDGASTVKDKAKEGAASVKAKAGSNSSDADLPKPVTTEKDVDMKAAEPGPTEDEMKN
ncbi:MULTISPECIES: hypothetical protein [Kocuria]|jgi:hypothetical protein|uniref:YtxH domain-containing protein n=1 Tax=Kocuria gwangalliensis TaxID=501592 RepID=A0ABP8X971_9MICC|nr:hypothetical protein [Kocuria sp.]MDO5367415.1 hypothetical protein [Kocuria sp.]